MSKRKIIHMEHHPHRVYVFDRHVHHGLDGVILIIIGLVLIASDWRDRPWWFTNDAHSYE